MILVVEPHADDAFLSLGGHIEQWTKAGDHVRIVTVYSGTRKRGAEAEAYARAVRAEWAGLGAKERRGGGKPGDGAAAIKAHFLKSIPKDSPTGVVILPLAPRHPDHVEVREALDELKLPYGWGRQYYLDQPYAAMTVNSPEVSRLLGATAVVSYYKPTLHKYKHIKLFKDQGRFWHFNPASELKHNPELIVARL